MYRIALCEDEIEICGILKERIVECFRAGGIEPEVHCFYCPEELLREESAFEFSAYFLDIEMDPDSMNGIALAQKIHQNCAEQDPVIIFISNREELVYESLKVRPLRFIRKSRFREEIREAVDAVIEKLQEDPDILDIRQNGQSIFVKLSDIFYIESQNRVQVIVTEKEKYQTYSKFASFCSELENRGFLQIHRSYLVNWKYIHSIDAKDVVLTNGSRLPVSKYKAAEVKRRYHQMLSRYLAM